MFIDIIQIEEIQYKQIQNKKTFLFVEKSDISDTHVQAFVQKPKESSWKSLSPNLALPFLRKLTAARHRAWMVVNRSHLPALHRRPPAAGWPCVRILVLRGEGR